jgi:hypothetical protein
MELHSKELSFRVRRWKNFSKLNCYYSSVVSVSPKIQHGPKYMKIQVGQRVDILCNAQESPPPVVTWLKSGRIMLLDGVQHFSSSDGTLSIN